MFVELFLQYIPRYWRWFEVFYEGTCGLAVAMQSIVVTAASWYITLMTVERFIVVWLPMKVCVTAYLFSSIASRWRRSTRPTLNQSWRKLSQVVTSCHKLSQIATGAASLIVRRHDALMPRCHVVISWRRHIVVVSWCHVFDRPWCHIVIALCCHVVILLSNNIRLLFHF